MPPAELESPPYHGALQVASRQEIVERTGGVNVSERELSEPAQNLNAAVRNLGADRLGSSASDVAQALHRGERIELVRKPTIGRAALIRFSATSGSNDSASMIA